MAKRPKKKEKSKKKDERGKKRRDVRFSGKEKKISPGTKVVAKVRREKKILLSTAKG